ncbi:MAG: MraY family glycosyltransferase [Acidobacteriota bacterium]
MILTGVAFLVALGLGLAGTPRAAAAALRFGIVDQPDGRLKQHPEPIPYLGGLAVYAAFLVALSLTFQFDQKVLGILFAGSLAVTLGLIDDLGGLRPLVKLAGQVIACIVLVKSGVSIQIAVLPEWTNLALTLLWVLVIVNAINFLDTMDGLATGVCAIAAFFLWAVAHLNGEPVVERLAAALVGSLLGFLRYNFHPARIYLGDTGSLFLGVTLAGLAMVGRYAEQNRIAYFSPLLILGVPIFEIAFVSVVRWLRGLKPWLGSADHVALRLRTMGFGTVPAVGILYLASIVLGYLAWWNLFLSIPASLVLLAVVTLAALGIGVALARVQPD